MHDHVAWTTMVVKADVGDFAMTHRARLLLAVAGLLASPLTPALAQSVDPSFYYKLSTHAATE
jgi:hypothetical protein